MTSKAMKFFIVLLAMCAIAGCATQSQISVDPTDQTQVSKALYYDAMGFWEKAVDIYLPYKPVFEQTNPDEAAEIKAKLNEAKKILDDWKEVMLLVDEESDIYYKFNALRMWMITKIMDQFIEKEE